MRRCLPPLVALLALACSEPLVVVGAGPDPTATPLTWQEHWYEHDQVIELAAMNDDVAVYVDGIRIGTVQALSGIPATNVREIRRLDTRDATTRFGTGHTAGAILIFTKSGR